MENKLEEVEKDYMEFRKEIKEKDNKMREKQCIKKTK
jgi:hypothetical protein